MGVHELDLVVVDHGSKLRNSSQEARPQLGHLRESGQRAFLRHLCAYSKEPMFEFVRLVDVASYGLANAAFETLGDMKDDRPMNQRGHF